MAATGAKPGSTGGSWFSIGDWFSSTSECSSPATCASASAGTCGEGDRASGPASPAAHAFTADEDDEIIQQFQVTYRRERLTGRETSRCSCGVPTYDELCGEEEEAQVHVDAFQVLHIQPSKTSCNASKSLGSKEEDKLGFELLARRTHAAQIMAEPSSRRAQEDNVDGMFPMARSASVPSESHRGLSEQDLRRRLVAERAAALKELAKKLALSHAAAERSTVKRLMEEHALAEQELVRNLAQKHAAAQQALSQQLASEQARANAAEVRAAQRFEAEKALVQRLAVERAKSERDLKAKLEGRRKAAEEELMNKFTDKLANKIALAGKTMQETLTNNTVELEIIKDSYAEILAMQRELDQKTHADRLAADKLAVAEAVVRTKLDAESLDIFDDRDREQYDSDALHRPSKVGGPICAAGQPSISFHTETTRQISGKSSAGTDFSAFESFRSEQSEMTARSPMSQPVMRASQPRQKQRSVMMGSPRSSRLALPQCETLKESTDGGSKSLPIGLHGDVIWSDQVAEQLRSDCPANRENASSSFVHTPRRQESGDKVLSRCATERSIGQPESESGLSPIKSDNPYSRCQSERSEGQFDSDVGLSRDQLRDVASQYAAHQRALRKKLSVRFQCDEKDENDDGLPGLIKENESFVVAD